MNTIQTRHPTTRTESFADGLTLRVDERGSGRPMLVLHGAAGPQSVSDFAEAMAQQAHVFAPTHPGFAGEPRPEWFTGVDDLALAYVDLLERLELRDVIVVGVSFGGWIAAEIAVLNPSRLGSLILVDAAGIEVEGHDIANMFSRPPGPPPAGNQPPAASPEQNAARAANRQAMMTYTQEHGLRDPKLRRRLARVTLPSLVVWGENDTVLPPDYGRAYAQSLPNARFVLISESGHLPQIDQPERLLEVVREFVNSLPIEAH